VTAAETAPVSAVAASLSVHRSTVYSGKNVLPFLQTKILEAIATFFSSAHQALRYYPYVEEIRNTRKLCLTTKCLTLMIAKFDGDFAAARQYTALHSWTVRFLKRNRLVVRRIIHKGTKLRNEMQDVDDAFDNSVNVAVEEDGNAAVEEDGVYLFHTSYNTKYAGLFNMDQTTVCMDNPGRLTIDYCGAKNVDVAQGTAVNSGRSSGFLCASETGKKLAPFVVFAGVPGGPESQEVSDPSFGDSSVVHTVQPKAFCDHSIMMEWIKKLRLILFIWRPSISGCRILLLDSLKVHKMTSVREHLEDACVTQVQYTPAGITGLSQPMDVSVMRSFKAKIQDLYLMHHIEHPFSSTAGDRRAMLSHLVGAAWVSVKPETIVYGFRKAKLLPIGPRDAPGAFRTYLRPLPEDSVVDEVEHDSE
ncbi:DDE superfamily endonuclease, partial [Phytophthora infestans]